MAATSSPKELAQSFADLIKRARSGAAMYFAVGKDRAGEAAVHVDKKKPNACVSALKAKGVAQIFASGRITFEGNALALACMKQPNVSMVRKTFALFFKKAKVIIPGGGSETAILVLGPAEWNSAADDEGDTSPEEEAPAASPVVESTTPTTSGAPDTGLRDQLVVAWKQLQPEIGKALADSARKATVQPLVAQFQALVQASSFEKAKPVLDQLAAMLKQGGAPSQSAEDPKARAAALMAEWNQLKPAMTQAAADPARRARLEALAAQFKQEYQGGKFDAAQKTLAGLAELSKGAPKTAAAGAGEQEFQKKWTAAKQVWNVAMETIDVQINQVAGKMRASNDAGFQRIADRGLPALTENHKTPVMRALFELDGPPSPARAAAAAKAKAAIAAFRSHVASSKEMKALDEHSQTAFGVALTLRKEINTGLAALDQALGALAV